MLKVIAFFLVLWSALKGAPLHENAQDSQQTLAEHFRSGQRAAAEKRFDDAIREFQAVLKIDPTVIQARANLGLMYYSKGEYARAAAQLYQVTHEQPDLLPGQLFLGLSYLNTGKPREAEAALRNALRLDPANGEAELALLTAYIDEGKYQAAGSQLTKLKGRPPEEETLYAIGQAYLEMGKALTSRLAQSYPSSAWAHRLAGDLATERQDWAAAITSYRAALAIEPDLPGVPAALQNALERVGKSHNIAQNATGKEGARNAFDAPDAKLAGAREVYAAGNIEGAERQFTSALANRESPEELYWLIRIYTEMGDESFAELKRIFPESARAHELQGEIFRLRQDFPTALREFKLALEKRPDDPELHRYTGEMMLLLDQLGGAEQELQAAKQLSPGNAENEYLLAQVDLKQKNTNAAIVHLKQALLLNPGLVEVHALLGTAYMHLNEPALAAPELEKALSIDYHGDLSFQLYKADRMTGNTQAAEKALTRSKELRKRSLQSAAAKISRESSAVPGDADANQ